MLVEWCLSKHGVPHCTRVEPHAQEYRQTQTRTRNVSRVVHVLQNEVREPATTGMSGGPVE